jgi:transketolase
MTQSLIDLRREILRAAFHVQAGHVPSAFSILEIVYGLYNGVMLDGDEFVLSKGHGALALYAVLGKLPEFIAGRLSSHPCRGDGITVSTGSLGHGLAIAAGMAIAKEMSGGKSGKIYCLVGDGECQEGSIWEAARIIRLLQLDVTCIVDYNGTHPGMNYLRQMFIGCGWPVRDIDGHNSGDVSSIYLGGVPMCYIAKTIKGKGLTEMENDPGAWHNRKLTEAEYNQFVEALV